MHDKDKNQGKMLRRVEPVVYTSLPGPLENCEKKDMIIDEIDEKAHEKETNYTDTPKKSGKYHSCDI